MVAREFSLVYVRTTPCEVVWKGMFPPFTFFPSVRVCVMTHGETSQSFFSGSAESAALSGGEMLQVLL